MADRTVSVRLRALTSNFDSGMRKSAQEVQRLDKGVQGFVQRHGQAMTRAGMAAVAFGGATALGLNKAADAANQLNAEMANVASLMPGQTARIYDLRDSVQTLAVDVGKSTSDITGGLYQVVSAFGDTADTADILRVNAEAARAGLASTTEAINLTSAVTKGYGDTTAEAVQQASDLALMTVRLGQTTFPELAASVGRVIPLAASLGVTQEELFAVMATGTGVTGTAAEVSTQLRGVLQSLMAPTADMTDLLEEHGFASGEAALADLGLQGAIEMVVKAAEDSGTPLQTYLSQIEGQTLALALAGPQADVFTDKLGSMGDAAGATEEALAEMTEGIGRWQFDAEQAAVQQEVAWQKLGEAVAPAKAAITGFIGDTAEAFSNLSPEMQKTAAVGGMAASGIGLVGGAALIATPKIAALNTQLAASGGILGTYAGTLRGAARLAGRVAPWIALGLAVNDTASAFNEAKQEAADVFDELINAADSVEEATRRVNEASEEMQTDTGRFGLALNPIRGLREAARNLGIEWAEMNAEVDRSIKPFGDAVYAASQFTPAVEVKPL